jgi:hypothetical protein
MLQITPGIWDGSGDCMVVGCKRKVEDLKQLYSQYYTVKMQFLLISVSPSWEDWVPLLLWTRAAGVLSSFQMLNSSSRAIAALTAMCRRIILCPWRSPVKVFPHSQTHFITQHFWSNILQFAFNSVSWHAYFISVSPCFTLLFWNPFVDLWSHQLFNKSSMIYWANYGTGIVLSKEV